MNSTIAVTIIVSGPEHHKLVVHLGGLHSEICIYARSIWLQPSRRRWYEYRKGTQMCGGMQLCKWTVVLQLLASLLALETMNWVVHLGGLHSEICIFARMLGCSQVGGGDMSVARVPKCVPGCQLSKWTVVLQLLSSFHAQDTIIGSSSGFITLTILHICKDALVVAK